MPPITNSDDNTPLSTDELADLIPDLSTKAELNEWERENILEAREWAMRDRTGAFEIPTDGYIRKLHSKMFGETWKWAGTYRKTEKNLGVPFHRIQESLGGLFGDVRFWMENKTYSPDEIAVRFHHCMVVIHPFPNGNGRHARMIADVLAVRLGERPFSWGATDLLAPGQARSVYLQSLRAADAGDPQPLLVFARS
jgi:Fic-DOC domain mobile mystery protein B